MIAGVGSLALSNDVENAVDTIQSGGFVAVQYYGVFIMFFAAANLDARRETLRVKNEEDTGKPLSSISFSNYVFPSVDLDVIQQPAAKALLSDVSMFQQALGTMSHLRLPIKESAVDAEIPSHMVSRKNGIAYVQNLDPYGNIYFAKFARKLNDAGVQLLAATSLNMQGEPEICDLADAKQFCQQRGVKTLLCDPLYAYPETHGSFPVIDLAEYTAIRDGFIPIGLVEKLLGINLDQTQMQPSKFPHSPVLATLCDRSLLNGPELRERILNHLYGRQVV